MLRIVRVPGRNGEMHPLVTSVSLLSGHIPNEYYLISFDTAEGLGFSAGRCMFNALSDVVILDSILGEITEVTYTMYSLHNILLSFSLVPTTIQASIITLVIL